MATAHEDNLITENMNLVYSLANRFSDLHVDREELASIGFIGLIKASRAYDPGKGIKFSTYAGKCIRNEILLSFRKKRGLTYSLDAPLGLEDKDFTTLDILPSDECVEDKVEQSFSNWYLQQTIETLPPREQFIIKAYYGIGCEPMKQHHIGMHLNLSQSYVTRLLKEIKNKLRKEMELYV